jgi:uncharacterized membrane protein required for colicin V production
MIAEDVKALSMDKLPFNWFDVLLLGLLVAGLFRGRKHGMTREILPLFKWLGVVIVGGLCYPGVAPLFVNTLRAGKSASLIYGYLLLAFVIIGVFMILKKLLAHHMEDKAYFGGAEYYLGMISGVVRFFCMLLAVLALLNAPYYSQAEIQARRDYNNRWYGGGLKEYSGDYLPDLPTIQTSVFKKSLIGPYLKEYLGSLLIVTTSAGADKPQPKPAAVNIQK